MLLQAKVGRQLDGYIAALLNGEITKAYTVAKKPELIGKKIIWQFWQQGVSAHTPKVIQTCLDTVQKHRNGYQVIVLSKDT